MECSLAGAQIARGDLQDAIRVDEEFDFHAREACRAGRNLQLKTRERAAILRQFAFALQDVDVDAGLILDAGGEKFLRAGGNGGVARDDFGDHAAHRFDAERERSDVEQQHVFHAAFENVRLHGGAERDHFIGIQLAMRAAAKIIAHGFAHKRNARGAADENDFVDLFRWLSFASARANFTGAMVRATMGRIRSSNSARVNSRRVSSSRRALRSMVTMASSLKKARALRG